jgi:hypothetical protein
MLFLMAGSTEKCAQLSTLACVVCGQLGGRYFAELASSAAEQESSEARQCLGHCYILDKSLAVALGRRSYLPDMNVNASVLIPPEDHMPSTPIFNIYIEFARIQDKLARELHRRPSRLSEEEQEKAEIFVADLRERMFDIRVKIRRVSLGRPEDSMSEIFRNDLSCSRLGFDLLRTFTIVPVESTALHRCPPPWRMDVR